MKGFLCSEGFIYIKRMDSCVVLTHWLKLSSLLSLCVGPQPLLSTSCSSWKPHLGPPPSRPTLSPTCTRRDHPSLTPITLCLTSHNTYFAVPLVKWNSYFMAIQETLKHKKFFSALWSPLSPHCALCICTWHRPNFPIGRNTCSTIKTNILLASARQLLKRQHSFLSL